MVMDFSGFSSRTISAPEIERYQMMDASHYSKITMPTFYINQNTSETKDSWRTGKFRDQKSINATKKEALCKQGKQFQQPRATIKYKESFGPRYEASPIKQQHLQLTPKQQAQSFQYKMEKVPQPQKPLLIEKNYVGGGHNFLKNVAVSKTTRASPKRSPLALNSNESLNIKKRRQSQKPPTFPDFFNKNAINQPNHPQIQFGRTQFGASQFGVSQFGASQFGASQFGNIMAKTNLLQVDTQFFKDDFKMNFMNEDFGRHTMKSFMRHSSGPFADFQFTKKRNTLDNTKLNDKSAIVGMKVGLQHESMRAMRQFAEQQSNKESNCRPILLESSVLGPQIDSTSPTTMFLDKTSSMLTPARSPGANCSDPKLLKNPIQNQTKSSFFAQQENFQMQQNQANDQRKTELTNMQTIQHNLIECKTRLAPDSTLSFRDYVEKNSPELIDQKYTANLFQQKHNIQDSYEGEANFGYDQQKQGGVQQVQSGHQSSLLPAISALKTDQIQDDPQQQAQAQQQRRQIMAVIDSPSKLALMYDTAGYKNPPEDTDFQAPQNESSHGGIKASNSLAMKAAQMTSSDGFNINASGQNIIKDNKFDQNPKIVPHPEVGAKKNKKRAQLKVEVGKRTSVHTLNISNPGNIAEIASSQFNCVNNATPTIQNRDSSLSLRQNNQHLGTSIITPKYFATVQAVKQKPEFIKDDRCNTLGLMSCIEDTVPVFDNKIECSGSECIQNHEPKRRRFSKDLEQVMPDFGSMHEIQMVPNYDTNVVANEGLYQQNKKKNKNIANVANKSSSLWRRKKSKPGQRQPLMTAQRIVQKNISQFNRGSQFYEDEGSDESPRMLGTCKQLTEIWPSKLTFLKSAQNNNNNDHQKQNKEGKKTVLPELKQCRKSPKKTVIPAQQSSSEGTQSVLIDNNVVINPDGFTEEIESILAPEFRNIVGTNHSSQTFEHQKNIQNVEISHMHLDQNPRNERRQVIKILDQARWRNQAKQKDKIEENSPKVSKYLNPKSSLLGNKKSQSASTMEKKRDVSIDQTLDPDQNEPGEQEGSISPTKTHDHVEGSVRLDSVFDHEIENDSIKPQGDGHGRRSHMIYNQDLMIEGISQNNLLKRSSQLMLDQICETEHEMKELMARDMLIKDNFNGHIDNPNFNTNFRFSEIPDGRATLQDDHFPQLNQTEFSQFIKSNDNRSTKQDFTGQFLIQDQFSHMNMTTSQLKPSGQTFRNYRHSLGPAAKTGLNFSKPFSHQSKDIFSPVNQQAIKLSVKRHKSNTIDTQSLSQQRTYPVILQGKNLPMPIEKLRNQFLTQKTIQLQKNRPEARIQILNTEQQASQKQTISTSIFEGPSQKTLEIQQVPHNPSTKTRVTQHHRALSELRQIQFQRHQEMSETSPGISPRERNAGVSPSTATMDDAFGQQLSEAKTPRQITKHKQKKVLDREAKLESLCLKQQQKLKKQTSKFKHPRDSEPLATPLDEVEEQDSIVATTNSNRNLSTCMDKHAPSMVEELQSTLGSVVKGTNQQQQVFVATSASNSKFLGPTQPPNHTNSPTQCVLVTQDPPFAIQQTKSFNGVVIEKSVLPQGRTYQNVGVKGHNKDIIDADLLSRFGDKTTKMLGYDQERAASSIIANYQVGSIEEGGEHSPKSYKMPANFMHGLESQVGSVQGGVTDSIGTPNLVKRPEVVKKSYRMPVHSFTTLQAQQKTHSSQVNSRKHILANEKSSNKMEAVISENMRQDSIELTQTLHMYPNAKRIGKEQIISGSGACIYHEQTKSCDDQMPAGQFISRQQEGESLQKIDTQVNTIIDETIIEAGDICERRIDTMRNSLQQTEFEQVKLDTRMKEEEDETGQLSLSDRASLGITKPVNPGANIMLQEQAYSDEKAMNLSDTE